MQKKLLSLIEQISSLEMHEQKKRFKKEFNDWRGDRNQTDDILVVGIRI